MLKRRKNCFKQNLWFKVLEQLSMYGGGEGGGCEWVGFFFPFLADLIRRLFQDLTSLR